MIQRINTNELFFLHWALFRKLNNERYSSPILSPGTLTGLATASLFIFPARTSQQCMHQQRPFLTCVPSEGGLTPHSAALSRQQCVGSVLIPSWAWGASLGCGSAAKVWQEPGRYKPCTVSGVRDRWERSPVMPSWKARLQCEVRQDLSVCCCQAGRQEHGRESRGWSSSNE